MKKFLLTVFLFLGVGLVLGASNSDLIGTTKGTEFLGGFKWLIEILTGPITKIVGVLLMAGAGLMIAFTEGKQVKMVLWIVIGVGVALNAVSFLLMLTGSGGGFLV